jgi:LacI family transcriptional regulator
MTRPTPPRRNASSITAVAVRAGVSIATVSRIMNGVQKKASAQTVAKVRAAVAELDYRPSSAGRVLRHGQSRLVAVLAANLANPAMAAIAASTEAALRERGLVMVLADTHERADLQDEYLMEMQAQRVRATVLLAAVASPRLAVATANGEALLFVNRQSPVDEAAAFVGIDNDRAGREVADFFVAQGRRHLAVIHGSLGSSATAQRVAGFKASLRRQKASGDPRLRIATAPGFDHLDIGYQAIATLLRDRAPIDGVFCTSDLIAFGAHRYLQEAGLVVQDEIILVGFDDSPLNDWIAPWLSSVRVPYDEFGHAIAEAIVGLPMSDRGNKHVLNHTLIVRSTIAA